MRTCACAIAPARRSRRACACSTCASVRSRPACRRRLLEAITRALSAGGQVLVFKNRRGYAPVLLCHDCGWSAQCRRCSTLSRAPMTVHGGGRRLQCHHCGARQGVPSACPDCASLALQPQGAGTERIEDLLAARFADVPVLRIDRGSTRRKDALERLFESLGDAAGHPGRHADARQGPRPAEPDAGRRGRHRRRPVLHRLPRRRKDSRSC